MRENIRQCIINSERGSAWCMFSETYAVFPAPCLPTTLAGEQMHASYNLRPPTQQRRNNVEISGIPATPNEDVNKIIQDVGTAIGMEVQKEDITAAHRIPTYKKERIPLVVVQFRERSLRDTWISKFRETKTLNAY
ncbi:hypothetical protein J6590_024967 [Homalodisca vitripennis]|nr:hypothetical protein J6590_024967 [Homalodisca vitripennis]